MAKNISLKLDFASQLKSIKQIARPLQTHHTVIMFVLLMGILIYAVQLVSTALQPVDDSEYQTSLEAKSVTTRFDQETIEKIDELKQRSDSSTIELPAGRRNPFVD